MNEDFHTKQNHEAPKLAITPNFDRYGWASAGDECFPWRRAWGHIGGMRSRFGTRFRPTAFARIESRAGRPRYRARMSRPAAAINSPAFAVRASAAAPMTQCRV